MAYPFKKRKLVVIAGHDDDTWETTGGKGIRTNLVADGVYEEYDSNIVIARELVERLETYDELEVFFPQRNGRDMTLKERVDYCNNVGADFVVFIHSNAGGRSATGACCFYYPNSLGEKFANYYADEMKKANYPLWQGGTFACNPRDGWSWFYVVTNTKMPVGLTENFFFSNPAELKKYLLDSKQLDNIATIHEKAVLRYFGLIYKKVKGATKMANQQPSSWATEAWKWAKEQKITDGSNPKDAITRQEVVTMLKRYHDRFGK
ncbi:N-acetylmuramoyl-L-alanine amidase family protein [Aquibacillus rhizosphaerae]|uniref:N-acetylmuramoyl-L-alanine amidase n=1 Tax=Aquibacillus rhizosphaerae TaxID=3051431 RepID=A0ABT7LAE6_9BACI|nr:N-acetylmuramoyl-L-alanine amidase [Aquibacillus sp. LR5S19]MDL4842846.1 N-acetylmuramoyl-L-alanine amidase [Aquibacillus sp. LR5S19]